MISFYKNNPQDKIWWVDDTETKGEHLFSFDKKKIYNLFQDYHKLDSDQKSLFDKENPFWAKFFTQ